MYLHNKVIKILSKEHGQKVKQFLIENGTDCSNCNFSYNMEDESVYYYYCIEHNKVINNVSDSQISSEYEFFELPEEKLFPRMMWVWKHNDEKVMRYVLHKLPGKIKYPYVSIHGINTLEEAEQALKSNYCTTLWMNAQEIEEPYIEEMTMQQICEALGKNIKIVK